MLTAAMALESWKDLFSSWEEPALDKQERLFSNRQLRQMLVPLFIEQILVVGLGLSDTFMVSFLGEAAVSGVGLVDQVNLIFLYLFIALGAGGAVIVSQYLGAGDRKKGNQAAGQLLLSATVLSAVLALGMGLLTLRPWMLRRILRVAVPNAIENGFFQLMKVALVGIVALFGTYQITANGIAQSIWSLAAMFGVTMGYVYITVIGRCMGAGLIRSASYYFRKLTCWTLRLSLGWNLVVLGLAAVILAWYPLAAETRQLVLQLVLLHNLCNGLFFPCSHSLSCGLRAAGDVKVPMFIAIFGTLCRIALSVVLGVWLQLGVLGVALAMCLDWLIRAILMIGRWQSGAWKEKQLI